MGWTRGPATITLTASDDSGSATVTYRANGGVSQLYSSPFTWTAEGATAIDYAATDAAGNSTAGSVLVQIDRTPPVVPGAPWYSTLTAHSAALNWFAGSDGLSGVARYDVYDGTAKVSSSAGTALTLTGLSPGSSHSYTVVAIDRVGNESPRGPALTVKIPAGEASVSIPSGTGVTRAMDVPVPYGTVPVRLAFLNVSAPGMLTVTRTESSPSSASGNAGTGFLGQYFNISFDGAFVGAVTVTLPYDPAMSDARARNLKLKHWMNNGWEDVPITVDLVRHTVTASLTSLSPLALAEPPGVNTTTRVVTASKLAPGYGRAAVVVARLVDASGTALPRKVVKVEVSRDRIAWSASATMTPVRDKAGSYSIGLATIAGGRTYVRVRFAADDFNQASSAVVTVLPQVDLSAVNVAASLTRTTTLSGSIKPTHRAAVTLELLRQISRTKWSMKRVSLKTNAAGKWSTRMTFTPGTWKLRVVAPADASHSASASLYRILYVR